MATDDDERLAQFLASLRNPTQRGVGHGLRRVAGMMRGGMGLAAGMLSARRRGVATALRPRDLAKLESLVGRLGQLKGLPMKMGQIMSYLEVDLPEEARRLLSLLQRQSQATPFEQVQQVLREDLGEQADILLAGLQQPPVSIASIGQVYRARLPAAALTEDRSGSTRSDSSGGIDVAVKVRHPNIDAAMRSDLRAAQMGSGMAGMILPGMGATARDMVAEVAARLLEECDYGLEAEHQRRFAALYAGDPTIVVPAVQERFCGPRVLTTTWQDGRDFATFAAGASQAERDHVGAALFDFYIGTLYRHGWFHADPHPGNYAVAADGRLVVFDYGCVAHFDLELKRAFVDLAAAVRADDRAEVVGALRRMGAEPAADDASYEHLRRLLRSFFKPMLTPGTRRMDGRIVIDVGQVMRDKLALARLRLPGRLLFLMRIRFGLYSVLSRLGAMCDWAAMEQGFAAES